MSKFQVATVQDILNSAKKYGNDNILSWDTKNYRDNKQKNPKAVFDCTWVDIKFKFENGDESILELAFNEVITSSAAKLPQAEGELKNTLITFRNVTAEELKAGDLLPKTKDSPETQDIEDKKKATKITEIMKNTNDFTNALDIIDKSYRKISEELKSAKTLPFLLKKNKQIKKNADICVFSIKQTHREDKEDSNNSIELELPLFRIKLLLDKTGNIAVDTWNSNSKSFVSRPNVYDARKTKRDETGAIKEVLATVKVNGRVSPLNKDNVSTFITYRSILTGVIVFKEMRIHKFGISLANNFKDILVKRNKSILIEPTFTEAVLAKYADENSDSDDDVEINDETAQLTNKFEKTNIAANDEESDLEDNVSDSDLEGDCEVEEDDKE